MTANQTRRSVMLMAWGLFRADPARAFGDCLRGAWKLIKAPVSRYAKRIVAAHASGARVDCGSLVKAPLHGFASGSSGHRRSGIITSRMGA